MNKQTSVLEFRVFVSSVSSLQEQLVAVYASAAATCPARGAVPWCHVLLQLRVKQKGFKGSFLTLKINVFVTESEYFVSYEHREILACKDSVKTQFYVLKLTSASLWSQNQPLRC